MLGLSVACERLIEVLDAQLARRWESNNTVPPEALGIAVLCTVSCAYYCEVALKTLQASRSSGTCTHGHDLVLLYDEIASGWSVSDLERAVLKGITIRRPQLPLRWRPHDIRAALEQGRHNFLDWRYGLMEGKRDQLSAGVPKALYVISCGIEVVTLQRHPELWAM